MNKKIKKICVTGAGGQIAYSLLFKIASGALLGAETPISLILKDMKEMLPVLQGVVMELQDCAFPLLHEIKVSTDPYEAFKEVDIAFLVGAKPRGPGMERKDLLIDNGKIFVEEGRALNAVASRDVKVLVVGNPCNTNCLIALHHAPDLDPHNFHAMMRLDQNRARALLAEKAQTAVQNVTRMTIWGNHSATQVPDFTNAYINNKKVPDVIADLKWLQNDFIEGVQKRGAAIIAARGKSSAASAAQAAIDAMRSLHMPTGENEWFSTAFLASSNPYEVGKELVFGFPCRLEKGHCQIVAGLSWDDFIHKKILMTQNELLEEREVIKHLLR